MRTPTCRDCAYCIDGMIPAGCHSNLGLIYQRCPLCIYHSGALRPCRECGDGAVFPADYSCLHRLLVADLSLIVYICTGCAGITDVRSAPDAPEPVALPDDEEAPPW